MLFRSDVPPWARDLINNTTLHLHLMERQRERCRWSQSAWWKGFHFGKAQEARDIFAILRRNLSGAQWRLALDLARTELQERRQRLARKGGVA